MKAFSHRRPQRPHQNTVIHPTSQAIKDLRAGRVIILVDDEDRENEGDFVFAAEKSTPEMVNLMMGHGRGLICMPMRRADTVRLALPQQVAVNLARMQTAFTVSIDASLGIGTGISAQDRCRTILAASSPDSEPRDLVRPGHVFPLEARDGGCLVRQGHTEAAVDLAALAGLRPAAVICEIMNEKGSAARLPELFRLAGRLGLRIYTIRDLVAYRLKKEPLVRRTGRVNLPTEYGNFVLHSFHADFCGDDEVFLALTSGKESFGPSDIPLVRVHAEWSVASLVRRLGRDGGSMLNEAMRMISKAPCGVIVFLRHGQCLGESCAAPASGAHPPDIWMERGELRTIAPADPLMGYGIGAQILRSLGVRRMRLLSNSDTVFHGIGHFGLEIADRVGFGGGEAR